VPDERIRAAVANWAPRFLAQGVDPNDFTRVTAPLERWEQWLDAWVANGDLHAGLARDAERRGRPLTAGRAWVHATLSYHYAKFVWLVDLNRHRAAADRAELARARRAGDEAWEHGEADEGGVQEQEDGDDADGLLGVDVVGHGGYSTVTLLARLRGLSIGQPRATATW
jgi:2,6-dihydroxypseudooxynicotine hydrolase